MEWQDQLKTKKRPRRRGEGRVAVIAHSDAIRKAIAEGYARKSIYEAMLETKVLDISYQTFTAHVSRYVEKSSKDQPGAGMSAKEAQVFSHNTHPSKADFLT